VVTEPVAGGVVEVAVAVGGGGDGGVAEVSAAVVLYALTSWRSESVRGIARYRAEVVVRA
jgi:hypothetical protein